MRANTSTLSTITVIPSERSYSKVKIPLFINSFSDTQNGQIFKFKVPGNKWPSRTVSWWTAWLLYPHQGLSSGDNMDTNTWERAAPL